MAEGLRALWEFQAAHQESCCIDFVATDKLIARAGDTMRVRCPRCAATTEAVWSDADVQAAIEHFERVMSPVVVESLDTELGQAIADAAVRILAAGQLPLAH